MDPYKQGLLKLGWAGARCSPATVGIIRDFIFLFSIALLFAAGTNSAAGERLDGHIVCTGVTRNGQGFVGNGPTSLGLNTIFLSAELYHINVLLAGIHTFVSLPVDAV